MSEDRDEAGQFAPSAEGLAGRAAEEAAAGFVPMPGRSAPEGEEFETVRDAADALSVRVADHAPKGARQHRATEIRDVIAVQHKRLIRAEAVADLGNRNGDRGTSQDWR